MPEPPPRPTFAYDPADLGSRLSMGVFATILGVMAAWMGWIVWTFLDGGGWFDFAVGLILDEVIFALAVYALANLIWAVFAPRWLTGVLDGAGGHLVRAIQVFGIVFASSVVIVILGGSIALALGWI